MPVSVKSEGNRSHLAAGVPPSVSDSSLPRSGSLIQNCRKEIIRKHAGVPAQQDHSPPRAILTHPRISQAGSRVSSSFRQDHRARIIIAVALGRCLGTWALEEMPEGRVRAAHRAGHYPGSPTGRARGRGCQQSLGVPPHPQPAPALHPPQLHPQPVKFSPASSKSLLSGASAICPSWAKILHSQQGKVNPSAAGPTAAPRSHSRGTKAPLRLLRTSASQKGCSVLALCEGRRRRFPPCLIFSQPISPVIARHLGKHVLPSQPPC